MTFVSLLFGVLGALFFAITVYIIACYIDNVLFIRRILKASDDEIRHLTSSKSKFNIIRNIMTKTLNKDNAEQMLNRMPGFFSKKIKAKLGNEFAGAMSKVVSSFMNVINSYLPKISLVTLIITIVFIVIAAITYYIGTLFTMTAANQLNSKINCNCYALCTGDAGLDSKCTYEILFGTTEYNNLITSACIPSENQSILSSLPTGKEKGEFLINYMNDSMVECYRKIVGENSGFKTRDGKDRTVMNEQMLREDLIALLGDYKVNGVNPLCDCDNLSSSTLSAKCKGEDHYKDGWDWEKIWGQDDIVIKKEKRKFNTTESTRGRGRLGRATAGKYTITLADGGTYYWYHQSTCGCVHNVEDEKFGRISNIKTGVNRGQMSSRGCSIYSTAMAVSNVLDMEITPFNIIQDVLGEDIKVSSGVYYFDGNSKKGIEMAGPNMTKTTLAKSLNETYGDKGLEAKKVTDAQSEIDEILVDKGGCVIFSIEDPGWEWYNSGDGCSHFIVIRKKDSNGLYYCLNSTTPGYSEYGKKGDENCRGCMNKGVPWETLSKHLRNGEGVGVWSNVSSSLTLASREDVYAALATNSRYAGKANILANVYATVEPIYGKNFAIGLMANVLCEGDAGKLEGSWYSNSKTDSKIVHLTGCESDCPLKNKWVKCYWGPNKCTNPKHGDCGGVPCSIHKLTDYSGYVIKSRSDVETLLTIGGSRGVGVGAVQWSGGRRLTLLNLYLDNCVSYTSDELAAVETLMILHEFKNGYSEAKKAASSGSPYDNAYNICYYYEKPSDKSAKAVERGNIATDMANCLSGIQ